MNTRPTRSDLIRQTIVRCCQACDLVINSGSRGNKVTLSPAYAYLNSTVACRAIGRATKENEETTLPLRGRKKKLSDKEWIHYLGRDRLGLNDKVIDGILTGFTSVLPDWTMLIDRSFLSDDHKELYNEVVEGRRDSSRPGRLTPFPVPSRVYCISRFLSGRITS